MNKFAGVVAAALLVLPMAGQASAAPSGGDRHSYGSMSRGNGAPGGGIRPGPSGGGGVHNGPGPGPGAGRGGGYRGGNRGGYRGGYRGYRGGNGVVVLGPGYYDPFWDYGYYPYGFGYGYGYGYDYPPPVAANGPPPESDYLPPDELGPPPEQVWYYCDSPEGYYPYVRNCSHDWQTVPATPPGGGAQDAGPPDGPPDGAGPDDGYQDNGPPNDGPPPGNAPRNIRPNGYNGG